MGLFDDLLDFDGDGEVEFDEVLMGAEVAGAVFAAMDEADRQDVFDEREAELDDMEIQLSQMQNEMPDNPNSVAYRRWKEKCKALEDEIDSLSADLY